MAESEFQFERRVSGKGFARVADSMGSDAGKVFGI